MSNHIHLLLTPVDTTSPARMMQMLGATYVGYINRRYDRTGSLWERRFRSTVVNSTRYVLACSRYIELNPVRAGLVSHPSMFPWSSYHRNGGGRPDALVVPHPVYQSLGSTDEIRRTAHRALLEQDLEIDELEDLRTATKRGSPLILAGAGRGLTPV